MTLGIVWFALVAIALGVYVVLDGFDFGVGILHRVVAKTDAERKTLLRSIGPVWDGNEVWLIAAAASLFVAFPKLFATAMSGFYLPLMIVLWLLVFRGLGIELRHQSDDALWKEAWDAAFSGASLLLAFALGAALGNVVRGVSLDGSGTFFAPLWTNLHVGRHVGVLDWYTITVGLTAVSITTLHGACWIADRTDDVLRERARTWGRRAWMSTVSLVVLTTGLTFVVQPNLAHNLRVHPMGLIAPLLVVASLAGVWLAMKRERHRRAFLCSAGAIFGLLGSAAYAIFPMVLPARDAVHGLSLEAAMGDAYALSVALWWWLPGMALATSYFVLLYRRMPATFRPDDPDEH